MTMTATISNYSHKFLAALEQFAFAYRNYGARGFNRTGAYSQLQSSWSAEFDGDFLNGPERALNLCRELVASGKAAFTV
jgi:hypothetical protein